MMPTVRALALAFAALALAAAAPAARATPADAAEPTPKAEAPAPEVDAEAVRASQMPSPGGSGRPLALLVDRPDFQLAVRGFGQFYAMPYVGKDALVGAGDAADFAGMRVRRLQVGLEGRGPSSLSFGVWMDLAQSPTLLQAWLAWAPMTEFAVEAGVVKVPFSRSALQSSAETTFSERPLAVDKLLPDRQPGVAVYGAPFGGRLSYRAGWFNGADPSRMGLGPDHPAGLFAARVAVAPLGPLRPGQGDGQRGPLRVELAVDAMQNFASSFTANSLGADLTVQGYGAALLLEYLRDVRAPVSQPVTAPTVADRLVRTGMIAQASYQVWGPLEVAARGELVDDNAALEDVGDTIGMAAGVHANFANVKAGVDVYHRVERFGLALANDTLVTSLQGRF